MAIKWNNSFTQVPMRMVHNPTDITAQQSANIVTEVLNAWNSQSPLPIVQQNFGNNTLSYSGDERYFGPGVVAVTVLSYNPSEGVVNQGNIYVNQTATRGFCLTADKAGNNCTTPGAGFLSKIYLGDVLTHEFGHLLGLGHSEVRDSSMLFTSFKGQHTPHSDDVAGVRSIYRQNSYGTISGSVLGGSRIPVFGAHVQAISTVKGSVAASAVVQENGRFTIRGLDLNDTYYLYVEPLHHLESLSDAYRSAKTEFCPGSYVGSFFETCGSAGKGHPQPLQLSNSRTSLDVGVITIRCNVRVGESYLVEKLSQGAGVYDFIATAEKPGESFVGIYNDVEPLSSVTHSSTYADTIELDYTGVAVPAGSAQLDLKILTTALGSALDFSVEIEGPYGTWSNMDRGGVTTPAVESGSLRPLYDRKLTYPLHPTAALNRFTVRLLPRALSSYERAVHLPLEEYFVIKHRPWLVLASVTQNLNLAYSNQTSILQDNNSCLDAPYTFAVRANPVSAAGLAGESEGESKTETTAGAACGTWQPPSDGGPSQGPWVATVLMGLLIGAFTRLRRFPSK